MTDADIETLTWSLYRCDDCQQMFAVEEGNRPECCPCCTSDGYLTQISGPKVRREH